MSVFISNKCPPKHLTIWKENVSKGVCFKIIIFYPWPFSTLSLSFGSKQHFFVMTYTHAHCMWNKKLSFACLQDFNNSLFAKSACDGFTKQSNLKRLNRRINTKIPTFIIRPLFGLGNVHLIYSLHGDNNGLVFKSRHFQAHKNALLWLNDWINSFSLKLCHVNIKE